MRAYDQVLVDVDTQFDFLDPGGNLYVPDGFRIHPAIERLFKFARKSRVPVISTADLHSAHDPEFAQFGRHCEAGTLGQRKLVWTVLPRCVAIREDEILPGGAEPLLDDYQQLIFCKSCIDVFANPHLGRLVESIQVSEYVVFGVAVDYCVSSAVEGLLARGARVCIVTDAVAAIDPGRGEALLEQYAARGVRMIRSSSLVGIMDDDAYSPHNWFDE